MTNEIWTMYNILYIVRTFLVYQRKQRMIVDNKFLNKTSFFQTSIMMEFVGLEENTKLPTIAELAERFDCGRGIIQKVLDHLQKEEYIKIKTSGHLGSYLEFVDDEKLLLSLGFEEIVGSMPILYSNTYQELSNKIYDMLKGNYSMQLAFVRGSLARLRLLSQGRFEFAVISEYTALNRIAEMGDIIIVHRFGPKSYVRGHAVAFSYNTDKIVRDGMRVGIDLESEEQAELTYNLCKGKDVRYVELSYHNFLSKLYSKEIDCLVWSIEGLEKYRGNCIPLDNNASRNRAVLIVSKNRECIGRFISKLIKKSNNKEEIYTMNNIKINIITRLNLLKQSGQITSLEVEKTLRLFDNIGKYTNYRVKEEFLEAFCTHMALAIHRANCGTQINNIDELIEQEIKAHCKYKEYKEIISQMEKDLEVIFNISEKNLILLHLYNMLE